MKKLNLFSDLWSSVAGSQRNDVEFDRRLTVGSPSGFTINWTLKLVSVLAILLTLGIGNAWGVLSSPYTCTFTAGMSMSGSNCTTGDVTWTVTTTTGKGSPTISFGNQNGQSCIKFGSGKSNYYSKMTLTTSAFSSYNVSSVVIYASSNNGGSKTFKVTQGATQIGTGSQSFSTTAWVTNITRNTTSGPGGDLSIEISSDATATFIHSIKVTYSAPSCTVTPTVGSSLTSVSATVSSITATVPISAIGGCNITENGLVYSTSNSTPTVGGTNCTKVTTTACGSTAANKTVTISDLTCNQSYYVRGYATNAAGTSYTNVTTQSTSACPKYTVTLKDDDTELEQATAGASVNLPSRTGCTGYTFAGWTKSWASAQSSWTTTAPTIINAGAYTPTADEDLYPVYTKTESGGVASYQLVTSAPNDWSGTYLIVDGTSSNCLDGSLETVDGASNYQSVSISNNTIASNNTTDGYSVTISPGSEDGKYYIQTASGYYIGSTAATSSESNELLYSTSVEYDNTITYSSGTFTISGPDHILKFFYQKGQSWRFRYYKSTTTSNVRTPQLYKKVGGSTTSYISVPNCLTSLGTIDGTLSMSNSTDGTVTISDWTYAAGSTGTTETNVSSYTVKLYKWNGSAWALANANSTTGGSSGSQATRTGIATNSKSVTYTGLEYGETYKFTVQPIGDGSTYGNGTETAATSINGNALTDNKFLNKYSIYIDDGTNNNYAHNYISSISSHTGSVDIFLNGGTDYYQYQLTLGGVIWWGNTGKMTSANCSGWTFTSGANNCKIQTAMAGTYRFSLAAGTPAISVTYPSANQASGHKIYFDNSVLNWSSRYYRIGRGDHNQNTALTLVTGTDNFYYVTTPEYDNMAAWHIANNYAWSGSNSIYRTKTNAEQTSIAITNSISFQQYVVTGDITIIPTTTHSTGGDDQNNNCEFYTINTPTSGMLTHTATVTAPTNGTITLSYTSKSGSPSTSTVSDLPHRTNLVITTTPATGYNRNTLTVNGAAFTSGNTHVLAADATIAATFSAKTYLITLDREGGTTGSASVTMTYNSSSHTAITAPTKAGFEFAGWWTGDDGTGSMVMNATGVLQANVADYTGAGGIWTKDATCTLYAKWTPIKTFVPVTSSTTLEEDDEIIFNYGDYFMSTTQNANNRDRTSTGYTKSGSNYLIPSSSTVQIAKLEATDTEDEWLFNVGTDAYLYAASSSSNHLKTASLKTVEDNGVWTISVDGSNNATIQAQGTNTRNYLKYNSNSPYVFSCYASGTTNTYDTKLYYYRRTDPYITVDPSSFETFTYAVGYGPSLAQAVTIKGYNLTGSLTIACPSGYELSSTSASSGFGTSITLSKDAKNKVKTTIYIRLAAGKAVGSYNQPLTISGGGITTENIGLTGSVVAVPSGTAYSLVTDEDDIFPDDEIVIMNASGTRLLSNKGTNNRTAAHATSNFTQIGPAVFTSTSSDSIQNIVIEGCDDEWLFKVATNSYLYAAGGTSNNYLKAAALNTAGDNGKWKIRISNHLTDTIKAQGASTRNWLWYNGTASPNIFSCYQVATTELPAIYAKPSATANVCGSPSALTDFETTYGEGASDAQSFKVKGRNLTSDITVTAPTGYEVCLTEGGTYTASVTLTRTDGKVAPTTVYVRLKDEEAGTIEGNITIAATGATTRNIAVTGTVAPNPEITLTGDPLLVTSRNGMNIMAKNTLTLNIRGARAGQTVSISGTGLKFYKKGGTPEHYTELTGGNALTAPVSNQVVYVSYNPTSAGTGAIATPSITVTCDGGSETFNNLAKARNLPDAVAIVAKVNGVWQALPANISSASNPAPVQVSVATDGGVKKAYGAGTLAYKLWPVKTTNGSGDRFGTYSSPSALNAAMVRFAGNSNKGLWANDNKSTNTINNNAAITDVTSDVTTGYEWTITTTEVDGQFVYNLTSTHGSNTNDLRLYSNKWGTYGSSSGTNELYILPLVEVQDAALTVMEWGTNEMAVSYPNGGSVASGTFKAMIGEGDKTDVTATSLGGDMYKLTGVGDLQANPGKVLTLSMTESSIAKQAVFTIPLIVTAEKTEAQLCSYAAGGDGSTLITEGRAIASSLDVIIRNGGRLTTGTAQGHFKDLYIYPGGKAKITKNFVAANVYMRGGYSFLDSKATYLYPDLCVQDDDGTTTVTTAGVKYDLYIDNRYYYTFAMPYDVTLASVTDETGSEEFNVWVKHYNGETRASGTHVSGWEWYGDEPGQGSFFAGIGYEITAKPRVSGRPVAIIRFPVKSGNITTDAAREIGVSVDNYGYDDYGSGSLAANNVGWNFVGNPYLTAYKAGTASPGNANDTLMLVDQGYEKHIDETTGVWDGTYDWKSSNKRFITVPYDTQTDYHSEYVATYTIPSFSAFFIQTTASGTFYMRGSRPQAAGVAPRFGQAPKEKSELHIDVLLSGEGESVEGKAGLIIHDKYEGGLKDFEDVEQWFVEQNELKTYTLANGVALAYNLTNEQTVQQPIPMGYIATVAGEHTYTINEANDVSSLAHLWLTDNETGMTTDLLVRDYTFTTDAGRYDERFAITAEFEREEVYTDVTDTGGNDWVASIGVYHDGNTLTLRGLPENSAVYVYDMTGKLMASDKQRNNVVSLSIAAQGVYNIRVVNGQNAVTLRSVIR